MLVLQSIGFVNAMLKDRIWYNLMIQIKPLLPQIKQALGTFFGIDTEVKLDGKTH